MQDIGALPHLASKALAKYFGDVGLVVDERMLKVMTSSLGGRVPGRTGPPSS
jgi:hypothetical protein